MSTIYVVKVGDKICYLDQQYENALCSLYLLKNKNLHQIIPKKVVHDNNMIDYCLELSVSGIEVPDKSENIEDLIPANGVKKSELIGEINILPGQYYPNIYRPYITDLYPHPSIDHKITYKGKDVSGGNDRDHIESRTKGYQDNFPKPIEDVVGQINQLAILKDMLSVAFDTIYPHQTQMKVYGHNIKNIVVLACIEFTNRMTDILRKNGIIKKNYTIKDFYKLKDILYLDQYSVSFPFFSTIDRISPFQSWKEGNPSKSLEWFDGYNGIKHNSSQEFEKASIENAIMAISALAILIQAQYGNNIPYWEEKIGSFFQVKKGSDRKIEDCILPPIEKEDRQACEYFNSEKKSSYISKIQKLT